MEYRLLGNSGLKVSVFGFGTMTFNSEEQAVELIRASRELGCNFYDNAELYGEPLGNAEILFGKALKTLQKENPVLYRRSDLVITTKLFWGPNPLTTNNSPEGLALVGKNESGTNRKHLIEGMKASLERLQLDYVDVVLAHRYDPLTPMEETVRAFTQLIRDGKALYWGTSCWPQIKVAEAYWVAKVNKLIAPIVEQPVYNMFTRTLVEDTYLELFSEPYNIGTTVWSPLDSGFLTGKYNDGIPENSRFSKEDRLSKWFARYYKVTPESKVKTCKELQKLCDEWNCTMVELALGWVLKNKNVTTCLLGAKNAKQLQQNFKALNIARRLDSKMMERIEKVLNNKPQRNPYVNRIMRSVEDSILKS